MSGGEVLIETHVIDNHPWLRGRLGLLRKLPGVRTVLQRTPLWRQYREFELHPQDQSNWFGPNVIAVLEAFQSAGFDIAHIRSWGNRAAFQAKIGALPARLLKHTYEGFPGNISVVGLHSADDAGGP